MTVVRRRVLVVEDHPDQALVLERWLEREEIEVHIAKDGEEGLFLARHGDFDAVISDLQLPNASGIEITRASKQASQTRPVMIMTAFGGVDAAIEALRENADDFLQKPLERRDVIERLRRLFRAPQPMRQRRCVLAIGAHPDDVEIGVGATLARHVASGDRVVIAVCSRGAAGGVADTRVREVERAAERLGAEVHVGNLMDTAISDGSDTIGWLEEVIGVVRPDVVYTHTIHDLHQDHRAVHRATLVAARAVPNVFCYQSPSTTPSFQPARFVDVSGHLATKTAVLACHGSQMDRPYFDVDLVVSTARYWGRFAGYADAEPLEVVRASR
ncbi:MAG: PIG-L family deacetylase [Myxococcota bacterium]